jgi:hypothetical protein
MRCKWVSRGTLGAENDRQREAFGVSSVSGSAV